MQMIFAIIRLDYSHLFKSLRTFSYLGVSLDAIFGQGPRDIFPRMKKDFYYLPPILEEETGRKGGHKRPLKIIELKQRVKGRNKQNELSLKIRYGEQWGNGTSDPF